MRLGLVASLSLIALLSTSAHGAAQSWPDDWPDAEAEHEALEWLVGSYIPVSELGAYGSQEVSMDPWITVGIAGQTGTKGGRTRLRFDMTVTPSANMRTVHPECRDCASETERITILNWRFLGDLTFSFISDSRLYLTAGPVMRVQMSSVGECPESSGEGCAMEEFARSRLDPGIMVGVGWEPGGSVVKAVQLAGRMNHYGRGELPEASPESWIEELELSVRFPFAF